MRVAILSLHVGAMAHYSAGLCRALADSDQVACFCPSGTPAELFPRPVEARLYPVPQWLRPAEWPKFLAAGATIRRLRRDIEQMQPDVLHLNSGHIWYRFLVPPLAGRFPVVSTLHDVDRHLGERRPFDDIKVAPLLQHSRRIMVHTAGLRERAIEKWTLAPDRVVVFPFCQFDALSHWATGAEERDGNILLFGRMRGYKGVAVMLEAMQRIADKAPNARLVIAGQGSLAPYRALIRKCADNVVVINRFLPERECARLFEEAAIVVAPYIEASQSAIPFLAADFAKPIVASRIGGIPEVVEDGHGGVLVAPGDATALADAVCGLLADPGTRRKMGRYAQEQFARRNGPHIVGPALRRVYEAAMASG